MIDPFAEDLVDVNDYPEDGPHEERQLICSCGRHTAGENCERCGRDLCPMCYELCAGYCCL